MDQLKIYVCHCSDLLDRKQYIIQLFEKHGITKYEFMEKFHKNDLTDEQKSRFVKDYKPSTMSLHLKHNYLYSLIANSDDHAMIFEDDVIFCDRFKERFEATLSELPSDFDLYYVGDGSYLHMEQWTPDKRVYRRYDGCAKCTDSYLIHNKCAKFLHRYIEDLKEPIELPIDHWLTATSKSQSLKVYWAEPTLVRQGTQYNMFKRSHDYE